MAIIKSFWEWIDEKRSLLFKKVERQLSDEGSLNYTIPQPKPAARYYNPALDVNALNNGLTLSSANSLNPITSQMISNQSSIKHENNVQVGKSELKHKPQMAQLLRKLWSEVLYDKNAKEISQQHSSGLKS